MTVMLAFPHGGTVRAEFMMSVLGAMAGEESPLGALMNFESGPVLSKARNEITRRFLVTDCEWLWCVDTDVVFTPKTLPALLEAADPVERPVMSAVYLRRAAETGELHPVAYSGGRDPGGHFWFRALSRLPEDTVMQVAAAGAGCLLVHRSVFGRLEEREPGDAGLWWSELVVDGRQFGEDMSFCLRCAMAGVPVHVHTGVQAGHVKPGMLGQANP